jgi:protein TonB
LAALAVAFVAQIKPILQAKVFTWNVALVGSSNSSPVIEHAVLPVNPSKSASPVRTTPSADLVSKMVATTVASRQSVQMVHPVVEPPKPIEPTTERQQPKVDPMQRSVEQNVRAVKLQAEPVVQSVATANEPEPVKYTESVAVESRTNVPDSTESAEVSQTHQSSAESAPAALPREDREAPRNPALVASHENSSSVTHVEAAQGLSEAPVSAPVQPGPAVSEAPVLVAKAVAPGSEPKGDHRWLAESLWRRVAELKRYPQSARLDGQEGRVVLKAVIRSDGQLADVSVYKSSGHAALDSAALEAVRLAFPLHMLHPIEKPEIVVNLPIVYSLSN